MTGFNKKDNGNDSVVVHETATIYGICTFGENCRVLEHVTLGYPTRSLLDKHISGALEKSEYRGVVLGNNVLLRPNTTVYDDVSIGDEFQCGHNVLIRENTRIGNHVLLGTNTIVDGGCTIGNNVSIQGNVYIPTNTLIENNVFIGPCAVLTNDKYPIRKDYPLRGPILRKGVSVGANSTILPDITVGEGAMVAAGTLVTKDVPPCTLAIGTPAVIKALPDELKKLNKI